MNGMNFKPFITKVLDSLSDKDVGDLYELINKHSDNFTNRSLVDSSNLLTASDKGVGLFTIQLDFETIRSGYLLYNNSYCVLLAYVSNSERVVEFVIANNSYKPVKEYLTTDFLRHEVAIRAIEVGQQGSITVQADDIDSENATEGQVLTADGEGGAEWTNKVDYLVLVGDGGGTLSNDDIALAKQNNTVARYGDGGEMYYKNSQNNYYIVFKATARVAGDDTIVEKLTLDLTEKTWSYSYDVVAAGESFTPEYDAALNEGSENAVQNKVITAALEDKANVDGNYSTMTVGLADNLTPYDEESGDDQDEPFSFQATGTANGTQADFATGSNALLREKQGHTLCVNQLVNTGIISLTLTNGHSYLTFISETYTIVVGTGQSISISDDSSDKVIDLTQMFNGDIPQDLLDHPENFFNYYQGSLAYNTGELVNANSRYIKCIGRNQWDEETQVGSYNTTTGAYSSGGSNICSKNAIKVVPNTQYCFTKPRTQAFVLFYDKDDNCIPYVAKTGDTASVYNSSAQCGTGSDYYLFTTPANCDHIQLRFDWTTYENNVTISIYYDGESGYDQYYPYEVLTNTDTGTEVLRQAGSVKDYKEPNGTIHRLVGNRAYQSGDENDSSLTTDGTTTNYPLETPTTEQGTTFSPNLVIDDFGSMEFAGTSGVPQGNLIFYPVDYKAFVDTLYNYTDGTPSNITLNNDLNAKFETYLKSLTGYDATATQVLKNVEGTLTWVTEE